MHVVIDIAEMVAELTSGLPREETLKGYFTEIAQEDAAGILVGICREVIRSLAGYHEYNGDQALRNKVIKMAVAPWVGAEPEELDRVLDEAFAEIFDNYRQEMTRQLRPHIGKKSLWNISYTSDKAICLTYVGDGAEIKSLMTAAGMDFQPFLEELYPRE